MKSLCSHFSLKGSLFWRYFSLLSIVVTLFLIALTTSLRHSSNVLQATYVEQTRENFYQNCDTFSNDLNLIHSLISTLRSTDTFPLLTQAEQPLSVQQTFHFSRMRIAFAQQCGLLSNITDGFVYFAHSSSCITRQRFYPDSKECFRSYYQFQDNFALLELVHSIKSSTKPYVFPAEILSIAESAPATYLPVLVKPQASSQVFGFFYAKDTILDILQIKSLPPDTYLKLVSDTGQILLTHNSDKAENEAYIKLTAAIPSLSSTAILGIPQSHFVTLTNESQTFAQKTLMLSFLLGILLCIIFSYMGVKPFQFLLHEHALSRPESGNEVTAIDNYLKNTRQNNAALRHMLLSNALIQAFYALPLKEEDCHRLENDFPIFQIPLLLAVIRRQETTSTETSILASFAPVLQQLPENTICEPMNLQEICIIVSADQVSYETFQRILVDINEQYDGNPRFIAGVSAIFSKITNLSTAVRQAQLCLPEDEARIIGHFIDDVLESHTTGINSSFHIMHMQQALSCWNKPEVLHMIQNAGKITAPFPAEHPEETFYNILTLLRNAAFAGNIAFTDYETVTYQHHLSPAINMAVLEEIAEYLFNQKTQLQVLEIQQLSQQLIRYMETNYSNPALSQFLIAQEFGVSDRFVHHTLLSTTGDSFNKHLLALRMQEAARLLRETDMSNLAIAELCGIPAVRSFYRNFKSYYHMTPAEYKESLTGGKTDASKEDW